MIYSQIKQGRTFSQIERSNTLRLWSLAIKVAIFSMLVGCVIGVIIHDTIIELFEPKQATFSQPQREKIAEDEWKRHIIPRKVGP